MLTSVVNAPVLGPEHIDMVFIHIMPPWDTRYPQSTKTWLHDDVCHPQPLRGVSLYLSVVKRTLWKPGASQTFGRDSSAQVTSIHRYHATAFKPLSICLTFKTACGWPDSIYAIFSDWVWPVLWECVPPQHLMTWTIATSRACGLCCTTSSLLISLGNSSGHYWKLPHCRTWGRGWDILTVRGVCGEST